MLYMDLADTFIIYLFIKWSCKGKKYNSLEKRLAHVSEHAPIFFWCIFANYSAEVFKMQTPLRKPPLLMPTQRGLSLQ